MTLEEYNKQRRAYEQEFDEAFSRYQIVEPKPLKFPAWAWYPLVVALALLAGYGLLVWLRIL
jgi:nitrate reductase NapE component